MACEYCTPGLGGCPECTTQPLDAFRVVYEQDDNVWWTLASGDHMNLFDQALERIDELTRQLEDARRIVVGLGYFQDHRDEDYGQDSDARDDSWRADPVGPVAWGRQVEQR